jgi:hypothetical protein
MVQSRGGSVIMKPLPSQAIKARAPLSAPLLYLSSIYYPLSVNPGGLQECFEEEVRLLACHHGGDLRVTKGDVGKDSVSNFQNG